MSSDEQQNARLPANVAIEAEYLVEVVLREQRKKSFAAVRSLWRVGDGVRRLRTCVDAGIWREVIDACASRAGIHTSSLDEAARAAEAFPAALRAEVRERFERARVELTASHVIALARVTPAKRKKGIDALLRERHSVRELRELLRRTFL